MTGPVGTAMTFWFSSEKGMTFFTVLFLTLFLGLSVSVALLSIESVQVTTQSHESLLKLTALSQAIAHYKKDNGGTAPTSLDDLVTPTGSACAIDTDSSSSTYRQFQGWCGPYVDQPIEQAPQLFKTDAWGEIIEYTGSALKSCGPNLVCGDGDDIEISL